MRCGDGHFQAVVPFLAAIGLVAGLKRMSPFIGVSGMNGHLLLTLVDHAKPFKGTWQIYKQQESGYTACHSPAPTAHHLDEPPSCQGFSTDRQVCRFTEVLQFYGWSIDAETPESLQFRQACSL
jgi:hypothetical protein